MGRERNSEHFEIGGGTTIVRVFRVLLPANRLAPGDTTLKTLRMEMALLFSEKLKLHHLKMDWHRETQI